MKTENFYVNRFNGTIILLKRVLPYFNLTKYDFENQKSVLLHADAFDEALIEIETINSVPNRRINTALISINSFFRLYVIDPVQDGELKAYWNSLPRNHYFVENVKQKS